MLTENNVVIALLSALSSLRVPLLFSVAQVPAPPISLPCYIFVLVDYWRAIQHFLNQYVYQTVV